MSLRVVPSIESSPLMDSSEKRKRNLSRLTQAPEEPSGPKFRRTLTQLNITALPEPSDALPPSEMKLWQTFKKALIEHRVDFDALPNAELTRHALPVELQVSISEAQGARPAMEDAYLYLMLPYGDLFGIFDGHGDEGKISRQAAQAFLKRFPLLYEANRTDIRGVFTKLCEDIHKEIRQTRGGTTALVCFRDLIAGRLYTMTLGDSEAFIFRRDSSGNIHAIPLSRVRNWSHPKEQARAERVIADPRIFEAWKNSGSSESEKKYFPPVHIANGIAKPIDCLNEDGTPMLDERGQPVFVAHLNVSRSLGDHACRYNGKRVLSQKPHVSLTQLHPGDLLVLGCDGVWDFVNRDALINDVLKPHWSQPGIAEKICDYALEAQRAVCKAAEVPDNYICDNVTVVAALALAKGAALSHLSPASASTQPLDSQINTRGAI